MSDFDDRDEYWTTPVEPRKTLRETNPLDQTPRYPDAAMETTSFGFRVPRHVLAACEDAYFDAVDRMREKRRRAESEQSAPMPQKPAQVRFGVEKYDLPPQNVAYVNPHPVSTHSQASAPPVVLPVNHGQRKLLGWDPPPEDQVLDYLRSGGS